MHPEGGKVNTLSLLNVAYNRRQFWDGRVETPGRNASAASCDDVGTADKALQQHIWGGFVRALGADERLSAEFKLVFGVDQPTQNSASQALATYLRTLLSGDSLHDQADTIRREQNAPSLSAEHFSCAVLKDEASAATAAIRIDSKTPTRRKCRAAAQGA